jgi:hypothetical protein
VPLGADDRFPEDRHDGVVRLVVPALGEVNEVVREIQPTLAAANLEHSSLPEVAILVPLYRRESVAEPPRLAEGVGSGNVRPPRCTLDFSRQLERFARSSGLSLVDARNPSSYAEHLHRSPPVPCWATPVSARPPP